MKSNVIGERGEYKNNNNGDEDPEAARDYVAEISHVRHHSNRNDAIIIARPTSF